MHVTIQHTSSEVQKSVLTSLQLQKKQNSMIAKQVTVVFIIKACY